METWFGISVDRGTTKAGKLLGEGLEKGLGHVALVKLHFAGNVRELFCPKLFPLPNFPSCIRRLLLYFRMGGTGQVIKQNNKQEERETDGERLNKQGASIDW